MESSNSVDPPLSQPEASSSQSRNGWVQVGTLTFARQLGDKNSLLWGLRSIYVFITIQELMTISTFWCINFLPLIAHEILKHSNSRSCLLFRMSNPSLLVDRDVIATSNHCTRTSKVRYYSTMKLLSNTIENLIEIIEKVVIFEQSPHLVFSFVTTRSVVGVCIHVRMIFSVK